MKIMSFLSSSLLFAFGGFLPCLPAQAHFQTLYLAESVLARGDNLEFALVFTHPFQGGPTMPMGAPRSFSVTSYHVGAEPVVTDLRKYLRPIEWDGGGRRAAAYQASIPREVVRSLGDYVFMLEPEPYLEAEEDMYIQQFTKVIVNVGGVPSGWANTQNVPVEIQPLSRPYANWTGGIFRAIVLSGGAPVPFAKVEIEYMNYAVDLQKRSFGHKARMTAPHPAYERLSALADANGVIAVGLPKAGWWGIAALDIGAEKIYKNKTISQDAVLWVQVKDMSCWNENQCRTTTIRPPR